jgi:hypothetical protein
MSEDLSKIYEDMGYLKGRVEAIYLAAEASEKRNTDSFSKLEKTLDGIANRLDANINTTTGLNTRMSIMSGGIGAILFAGVDFLWGLIITKGGNNP